MFIKGNATSAVRRKFLIQGNPSQIRKKFKQQKPIVADHNRVTNNQSYI